jgi:hypothetical protein
MTLEEDVRDYIADYELRMGETYGKPHPELLDSLAEGYRTRDNRPTTLERLVRTEPDWACQIIRWYKKRVAEVEKEKEIESIWKEKK